MKTSPGAAVMAALLLTLPGAAWALLGGPYCDQSCIDASIAQQQHKKDQVLDAALVAAAAAGVITYIAVHMHHRKNTSEAITGCVENVDGMSTIVNEKNQASFALAGNVPPNGGRLTLRGAWSYEDDGGMRFKVERISHNYGPCR